MSRIAVPAVALATALAAVLSAKRHADARALDNVGLRGGLTERDLDEYEALLASADPKLRNKAIEKLTELALVGSYKSRLMDTLDGQHGATEPEQYMASAIIAELSRDELNKARLAENGALFLLGKQLKSSTSDRVRQHCAQAIYRIIFNDVDRRLMVATCGLVPELLAILLSQDQCPHGLVYYSIGILHQFSQCGSLRDSLQEHNLHIVACQFWRNNFLIRDLEVMASYVIQNMIELATDAEAKQILGDFAQFKAVSLACALLLTEHGQIRALTLISAMAKHGMYVDELVKRPFVAPTVLGLIAHDGYSKAQNALMCLTVLCTASDEVSVQLLESDVLKSLQPCIVYGSSGLKVLAMVLLGQLLEVGFSVTRVVSSGLLPHVTKLAAAEPVAAKLLWQLIRLDTQHRFALGKPMPTTTQIKDLGVLGSEKTQDTVVKMVTAGDASIMEIGLRVVARVIGGRVPEAILDSLLTRGLFDALRKCLLQSSSADHVLDATTALLVLLNRGKITADAMHASVSQVLLHNLQIRIPEARDLLNKLYTATAAPTATKDINPVQLLSFIEMHRKLIALVRALQSCIGNAELYAKLAARHAFELGMIARQAVWFIGTLHNDATGAIYFHRGLSTTCARIQAAQKSGKAKSAPPEAQPTEKSLVSFRVAWFQLVKALSQLCVGMFQYEDLRKGLIKQELPGRLFLVHLITGVAFPLADFVQVIHHLPPAECLTTYHDVLHASAVSLFVSDPDPEKKHIPGLHRRVLAHTGAVGSTPVLEGPTVMRTRMVATPGCESTLEICESMPQCLSTNSWSAQTAMGSVGVSGSGQWRFRVLMSDSDHEAVHIGFARAGWTPRPSLRHEFAAVDPRAYLIGGGSGGARPIADGEQPAKPTEPWTGGKWVTCTLDLDAGTISITPPSGKSYVAYRGIDRNEIWFPAISLVLTNVWVELDTDHAPHEHGSVVIGTSLEQGKGYALPLPSAWNSKPTALAKPLSPQWTFSDLVAPTYFTLLNQPDYMFQTMFNFGPGPQSVGWRLPDYKNNNFYGNGSEQKPPQMLLYHTHGEYEAVMLTPVATAVLPIDTLAQLATSVTGTMVAMIGDDGVEFNVMVLKARHRPEFTAWTRGDVAAVVAINVSYSVSDGALTIAWQPPKATAATSTSTSPSGTVTAEAGWVPSTSIAELLGMSAECFARMLPVVVGLDQYRILMHYNELKVSREMSMRLMNSIAFEAEYDLAE